MTTATYKHLLDAQKRTRKATRRVERLTAELQEAHAELDASLDAERAPIFPMRQPKETTDG